MKNIALFLLMLVIATFFTGCKNNGHNVSENDITKSEKVSNVKGFSCENFNIETDDQIFFDDNHSIIACEEGYYYFSGEFLFFLDKNSEVAVPLCNKPNCTHTSEDLNCNAYFDSEQYYNYLGLFYYNSSIYILGNDGKSNSTNLYLYKISKDGSKREQFCHLVEFGSNANDMKIRFIIHKGVGYLAYGGNNEFALYSFVLNDKNSELKKIDEINGVGAEIYRLYGCDSGVSYQYGCFVDESLEIYDGGIKIYLGNNPQVVVDNAIKPYVIANANVYYETSDGIKVKSLNNNLTTNFLTVSKAYSLDYDGKYFYAYDIMIDGSQSVYVYDNEQNFVCDFSTPTNTFSMLFGDENRFFCMCFDDNQNSIIKYFDKSQIKTGKINWENIK